MLRSRLRRAFSLLELLVGVAVLLILVTLLFTAFSNFSLVTSTANRRLETSKQPRTMFDRMSFDIGSAVTSGGVKMVFRKDDTVLGSTNSNNDVMVLLTDAKTRDSDSRFAKIGYGVGAYFDQSRNITNQTVLRYVQTFNWTNDPTTIDMAGGSGQAAVDSQPIAPGIVRFELAFVNEDGSILASPPATNATADQVRDFYDGLAAIICTVATLDEDTLQKLTPTQRNDIAKHLGDAVSDPEGRNTPLALWQAANFSDLPRPVAQGLRFSQRYFRLK